MIFLIDSGHGGMVGGNYVTAPAKMFKHGNGEVAYEGIINRKVKELLFKVMDQFDLTYVDVCPTELDLSLSIRVNFANHIAKKYERDNCLYVSLHSNAGGGTGSEFFTSKGDTVSDIYATMLYKEMKESFPDMKLRTDYSDGDPDKEADFFVLKNTICPAILSEFLFFDNFDEWQMLKSRHVRLEYVNALVGFFNKCNAL